MWNSLTRLQKNVSDKVWDFECTRVTNVVDCQVQPIVASGLVLRVYTQGFCRILYKKKKTWRESLKDCDNMFRFVS